MSSFATGHGELADQLRFIKAASRDDRSAAGLAELRQQISTISYEQ